LKYSEKAISFFCQQEKLVGILAEPEDAAAPATGVIVIVGGPQYRAGSHRQFVQLSRALAAAGYPVFRFDYRGMGDSAGEHRDFLAATPDIAAAIDAMQAAVPTVRHVALWGLCDAASAALLYCDDKPDPRVRGLCLLNPWVRSDASLARAHVKHYYGQRLRQKEFWLKLLSGKVAGKALAGLWHNLRTMAAGGTATSAVASLPFQARMARAWVGTNVRILLVLSGDDYTAREFMEFVGMDAAWAGLLNRPNVDRQALAGADHTFSSAVARARVEAVTLEWLQGRLTC
jgi:exosortase A-associated hydrolase 1